MRVTNRMITGNTQNYIQWGLQRLSRTQEMMSTTRSIIRLSDDPNSLSQLLQVKSRIDMNEQYKRNTQDGLSYLEAADTAFDTAGNILQKAMEYTNQANNGYITEDDLKAIGHQIDKMIDELKDIGNTTVGGKYIFAGTDNSQPPFERIEDKITYGGNFDNVYREISDHANYPIDVPSFDYVEIKINVGGASAASDGSLNLNVYNDDSITPSSNVSINYNQGDSYESIAKQISSLENYTAEFNREDNTLTIKRIIKSGETKFEILDGGSNALGSSTDIQPGLFGNFNGSDNSVTGGIFDTLIKLKNDLINGDPQNLDKYLGDLNAQHDELLRFRVRIGARYSHFESVQNQLLDQEQRLKQVESNLEDVDIAKVSIDLSQNRMVYEASLSAGAQILNISLLNFLK